MAYDKNNDNAFGALIIFIIIIIIILILYENNFAKRKNEQFLNYQEAKTKTLNWCDKMKNVNLITSDQFNQCVATYKESSSGVLPNQAISPVLGMEEDYSLYNTRLTTLSSNLLNENTNTVMFLNNTGMYMGCDSNNNVYFVKDIHESNVNQKELTFNFVPKNSEVYVLMSSYGKYLIANIGVNDSDAKIPTSQSSSQEWNASFNGITIGPMVTWKIKKYESDNDNLTKVSFESFQMSNYFLSSTINEQIIKKNPTLVAPIVLPENTAKANSGELYYGKGVSQDEEDYYGVKKYNTTNTILKSLVINYGNDDTNIWKIIPIKTQTSNQSIDTLKATYVADKNSMISNLASSTVKQICIKEYINALQNLKDTINSKYINIENYVNDKINIVNNDVLIMSSEQQNARGSDSDDSEVDNKVSEMTKPGVTTATTKPATEQISPLQRNMQNNMQLNEQNINMTYNDKLELMNNIKTGQTNYLNQINQDISSLSQLLSTSTRDNTIKQNEYNTYLSNLSNQLATINTSIQNNITQINQYSSEYTKLSSDITYFNNKKNEIEKIDNISTLNKDMLSKYNDSNSGLIKIYPMILFILLLIILYLMYITYQKFMENIYYNY